MVQFNRKEDTETLKAVAQKELGNQYDVEQTKMRNPEIRIFGIRENVTKAEIRNCIVSQNNIFVNEASKIEVNYVKKEQNNHYFATVECDSSTFDSIMKLGKINVGWSRCGVVEKLNIWRCYKCSGYNHKAANCKNKLACGTCAGEHSNKDCPRTHEQCVNCISANKILKLKLDTNHTSFDKTCTVYKRKLDSTKNKINYV